MASTYTPTIAIALARKFIRDAPVTSIDSQLCDIVHSILWTYYPWKWAQKALTALTGVDGTQDYTIDAADTDFWKLLRVRIVQTNTTPDIFHDDIKIREWLSPDLTTTGMYGIHSAAQYQVSSTIKIRLNAALSVTGSDTYQIQGEYWKNPVLITDATLSTAFVFDDRFFPVFMEGLKWKAYEYLGDSRAGTVQVTKSGQQVWTGQAGIFFGMLQRMAEVEDFGAETQDYPEYSLGAYY